MVKEPIQPVNLGESYFSKASKEDFSTWRMLYLEFTSAWNKKGSISTWRGGGGGGGWHYPGE